MGSGGGAGGRAGDKLAVAGLAGGLLGEVKPDGTGLAGGANTAALGGRTKAVLELAPLGIVGREIGRTVDPRGAGTLVFGGTMVGGPIGWN